MKTQFLSKCSAGAALSALWLAVGCSQQSNLLSQSLVSTAQAEPASEAVATTNAVVPAVPDPAPLPDADSNAVARTATDIASTNTVAPPLPPSIRPSSPAAEVIKLAQAGVDESVMLTFVTNSSRTFNLGSDEIIYLNDIGVPGSVVTAMIQRDQALALAGVTPPASVATAATTAPAETAAPADANPPPEEPTPDYTADTPPPPEPQPANVTYNYFYDSLSPYGTWIDVEGYGRCWQPTVVVINRGWRPYGDRGHWVYTDCGWYWMSDYSWGWAPFHYGRWFHHVRWGWCWWPDSVWAPAWVAWRYSDAYCGWAPLPPAARFRPGFGFSYFNRSVGVSFEFGLGRSYYTFVPWRHFAGPRPYAHYLPRANVTQIYNHTTVINNIVRGDNNIVVNRGVPVERVQAFAGTTLRPVTLREARGVAARQMRAERLERDGQTLTIHRPNIPLQPSSPAPTARAVRGAPTTRTGAAALTAGPAVERPRPAADARDRTARPSLSGPEAARRTAPTLTFPTPAANPTAASPSVPTRTPRESPANIGRREPVATPDRTPVAGQPAPATRIGNPNLPTAAPNVAPRAVPVPSQSPRANSPVLIDRRDPNAGQYRPANTPQVQSPAAPAVTPQAPRVERRDNPRSPRDLGNDPVLRPSASRPAPVMPPPAAYSQPPAYSQPQVNRPQYVAPRVESPAPSAPVLAPRAPSAEPRGGDAVRTAPPRDSGSSSGGRGSGSDRQDQGQGGRSR